MFILLLILIFLVINTIFIFKLFRLLKNHNLYTNELLELIKKSVFKLEDIIDFWDYNASKFLDVEDDEEDKEE